MKKKKDDRKCAPVPIECDYRAKERDGDCPKGDCKTPDGISGYWGDQGKQV